MFIMNVESFRFKIVVDIVYFSMAVARASKCKAPQSKKKPDHERNRSPKTSYQKKANAEKKTSKRRKESVDVWLMKERKKKDNALFGKLDESVEYDGLAYYRWRVVRLPKALSNDKLIFVCSSSCK
jgi:hypothetical protein